MNNIMPACAVNNNVIIITMLEILNFSRSFPKYNKIEINQMPLLSTQLPAYVTSHPDKPDAVPVVLRKHAESVDFPLSEEVKQSMEILSLKFDREGTCAGLAAPQIGISKRIIVFSTPTETPALKIWRTDLTDTMPKTIWFNPTYEGVKDEGYREDYEGCFSVEGVAGTVRRFKQIRYTAQDIEGTQISGTANGYLARLIQHEIDHLNGVLFTDIAKDIFPMDEYRRLREEAVDRGYR